MNRGRRGEKIFKKTSDYISFIDILKDLVENFNLKIAAYCLLSNHYHLLAQTPDANISRSMRHLNGVYTQRFNRFHNCDGQLFRGRYKSIVVEGNAYLIELVRYIHRNPIEAGLVKDLQKYTWSSHKGYLSTAKNWDWLHKNYILSFFANEKGESVRAYRHFVAKGTSDEINEILSSKKLPIMMGSKNFVDKVKEMFFSNKRHEEVPGSRSLAPDVNKIIDEVCKFYDVENNELLKSKRGYFNEPRNVAIYLIRNLRGETLKGVGEIFGINRNSTVSSVVERLKREIRRNKKIKKRVEHLKATLVKSQA